MFLATATLRLDDYLRQDTYAQNPYPIWDQLREEQPIHWSDQANAWIVTSYSLVREAGKHPCIGGGPDRARSHISKFSPEEQRRLEKLVGYYSNFMAYMNPPQHTTQRGYLGEAFTRRVIEDLRPAIQRRIDEILDQRLPHGKMDMLRDFALPISSSTILDMLGIDPYDRQKFIEWIDSAFDFLGSDQSNIHLAEKALDAYLALSHYLQKVVADRRENPQDDLITDIVSLQREQPELSDQRLLSLLITVIHGGWETTMTLISNGTLALLQHPVQWQKLRQHPELLKPAIEEILRFEGPFKGVTRVAQDSFTWEGTRVRQGDALILMLAAANRDPQVFDAPRRFDVTRKPNPHVAFGVGSHYCLGAALAQVEAQAAFATITRRLPNLRLADQNVRWSNSRLLRQLDTLPVEF